MTENSNQPRHYDGVKGNNNSPLLSSAVLGGLPGVQKRLASADVKSKLDALKEALNQGQAGLNLVIQALKNDSEQVKREAYLLLRHRQESQMCEALQQFNPYEFFKCVQTLKGHTHQVNSIVLSPDGQILASCGNKDGTINLWRLSTGDKIATLMGHSQYVTSLAISPDGQTLVSGSRDKTIRLWQMSTGQELCTFKGHKNWVQSISISPDGQTLVSGGLRGTLKLWDMSTGQEIRTLTGHTLSVYSVVISPDSQILASGSGDNTIRLWQLSTGQELHTLMGHIAERDKFSSYQGSVDAIAISPDGQTLASAGNRDGTIELWQISTGEKVGTLIGHTEGVRYLTFSPDGQTLASGSWDKTIKLWRISTGQELCTLTGHRFSVTALAFTPDGQTLVSGCGNKTIKIWQ